MALTEYFYLQEDRLHSSFSPKHLIFLLLNSFLVVEKTK